MVAIRDIQAYSDAIAKAFAPQQIILFGSHARGQARPDSDVDLLVIMVHEGHPTSKAIEIRTRAQCPFPLDLLVRSPEEIHRRAQLEDWFIRDILQQGKVLYEADHHRVDRQGGRRLSQRRTRDAREKGQTMTCLASARSSAPRSISRPSCKSVGSRVPERTTWPRFWTCSSASCPN